MTICEGTLLYFTVKNASDRSLCFAGHAGVALPSKSASTSFLEGRIIGHEGDSQFCLEPNQSVEIEVRAGIHWITAEYVGDIYPTIYARWQNEKDEAWMPSPVHYNVTVNMHKFNPCQQAP
jgi:hypothetical protein